MKYIMKSLMVAFKEIITWDIIKYVLLIGTIVTAFWIGVGFLIWDYIVLLSSHIVELVPFSMIRSNGAWMLSSFLWLQLVLVTFALIHSFFGNLILQYVSKERYSSFSILILILSALLWGIVWFFEGDYIYSEFLKLLTWLPFETLEKGIAFLIGYYIIYNAIIITMLFVTSILSEPIISSIAKKHFNMEVVRDNLFISIKYTLKNTLIFILASIILFPLLFVPIINLIIQILLWVWLIKDTISIDALSLANKQMDLNLIKEKRAAIWFISFVTALFNFIPILNLFSPFFGEIAMFYYFKSIINNK